LGPPSAVKMRKRASGTAGASSLDAAFLRPFRRRDGRGLKTEHGFRRGEVLCAIPCTAKHRRPARPTIQLNRDTHIEIGALATLNHSCDPNVLLDTKRMVVVAARDIGPGEELTFFYPSTEWDMAAPFECVCRSPQCLGLIQGAKHLPADVLRRYFINHHILELKR
jgi:hypothetical protein